MKSLFNFLSGRVGRRFAVAVLFVVCCLAPFGARAQSIIFERVTSDINDDTVTLSHRESIRVERFLRRVYPTRAMKRAAHNYTKPHLRKASYDVIKHAGVRYILVAYVAEWEQFVHLLALYRMGSDGPVQVWRSDGWRANYNGLSFETTPASKQMLVLFKEGGLDPSGFSLSGVIRFRESKNGIVLRDLTPRLPHLHALTNFPCQALYGKKVLLQESPEGDIILAASDDEFGKGKDEDSPTNFWRYNVKRGRFEALKHEPVEETITTSLSTPQLK